MKRGIHPNYTAAVVTCGCGNTFTTISTMPELRVEICSECHPYYTGKQKFVDTAGRVQKFEKRFQWNAEQLAKQKSISARKAPKQPKKPLPTKTKGKTRKETPAANAPAAAAPAPPPAAEAAAQADTAKPAEGSQPASE